MVGKPVVVAGKHEGLARRIVKGVMSYLFLCRDRERCQFRFANHQIEAGLELPDAASLWNEFLSDQAKAMNTANTNSRID